MADAIGFMKRSKPYYKITRAVEFTESNGQNSKEEAFISMLVAVTTHNT